VGDACNLTVLTSSPAHPRKVNNHPPTTNITKLVSFAYIV